MLVLTQLLAGLSLGRPAGLAALLLMTAMALFALPYLIRPKEPHNPAAAPRERPARSGEPQLEEPGPVCAKLRPAIGERSSPTTSDSSTGPSRGSSDSGVTGPRPGSDAEGSCGSTAFRPPGPELSLRGAPLVGLAALFHPAAPHAALLHLAAASRPSPTTANSFPHSPPAKPTRLTQALAPSPTIPATPATPPPTPPPSLLRLGFGLLRSPLLLLTDPAAALAVLRRDETDWAKGQGYEAIRSVSPHNLLIISGAHGLQRPSGGGGGGRAGGGGGAAADWRRVRCLSAAALAAAQRHGLPYMDRSAAAFAAAFAAALGLGSGGGGGGGGSFVVLDLEVRLLEWSLELMSDLVLGPAAAAEEAGSSVDGLHGVVSHPRAAFRAALRSLLVEWHRRASPGLPLWRLPGPPLLPAARRLAAAQRLVDGTLAAAAATALAEAEAAATKVEDGGGAAAAGITASGGIGEGGAAAVALGAEGGACPPPLPPPLPPPPVLLRCAAAEVVRRRRPAEPRAPAQDPSGPYHGRDRTTRPSQDAPSPPRSPAADSKEPQPMPPALPRSLHSCASSCSLATASSASSSLSLSSTSFTCVLPAPSLSASDLAPHPATTTMPATQNAPSATDPSAPAAKPSAATTSTSYTSATSAFALPATRASGAMSTLSPASSSTSAFAQPATPSAAASTSAGPAAAVASTTAAEVADLVSVGFSLIAMGHENTSGAAAWALTLLAAHPGSQRRLRAELESELGLSGAAVKDGSMAGAVRSPYVYGALARLPYLGAVVQEALRLFPPVPVLSRQSAGPAGARAGGCDVRPGEELLVSPYVLHRLPGLWDRPHEFRPERFLERASGSGSGNGDSGCSSEGPDSVNGRIGGGGYGGEATTEAWRRGPFMAFGSGPRTCIGAAFGLAEVKLLVAHVILRYDMDLVDQDLMRQMDLHDGGPGRGSGPGAGRPEGTGLSGGGGQVYAGAVRDGPGAGGLPQRLFVSLRPAQGLGVRFRPRSHTS